MIRQQRRGIRESKPFMAEPMRSASVLTTIPQDIRRRPAGRRAEEGDGSQVHLPILLPALGDRIGVWLSDALPHRRHRGKSPARIVQSSAAPEPAGLALERLKIEIHEIGDVPLYNRMSRTSADVNAAKVPIFIVVLLIAGMLVLVIVRPKRRRSARVRLSPLPISRESQEEDSSPQVGEAHHE